MLAKRHLQRNPYLKRPFSQSVCGVNHLSTVHNVLSPDPIFNSSLLQCLTHIS